MLSPLSPGIFALAVFAALWRSLYLVTVFATTALVVALSVAAPVDAHHKPGHGGPAASASPAPTSTVAVTNPPSTPIPTAAQTLPPSSATPPPSTPTPPPATAEPSPTVAPIPELTSNTCGTPSNVPVTASTTWTYFTSPDPCVYRMRVYSSLRGIFFIDDTADWLWWYEPVATADETAAFEYGGLLWTYRGEEAIVHTETGDWSEPCPDETAAPDESAAPFGCF